MKLTDLSDDELVASLHDVRIAGRKLGGGFLRGRARRPLRSCGRGRVERRTAHAGADDAEGRRCSSRAFLEVDHVESRALGGSDEATNLRVLCRAHNKLHAQEVFGRKYVQRRIHFRQRNSEAARSVPDTLEAASRGLVRLGFREHEVRRAVCAISRRHVAAPQLAQHRRGA
jgi:hypothetical protein